MPNFAIEKRIRDGGRGVAGIDEGCDTPVSLVPMDVLGTRHRQVAPADGGAAVLHTQALVGIAPHGLGAASATVMLATVAAIVVPYLYSELRSKR